MNIKIIFFDIDGTLVGFDEGDISEKVKESLRNLNNKGIKLFLATGRAPYMIPEFEGVEFDGAICFNGGYCFERDNIIYSQPLEKDDIKIIVDNARKMGIASAVASTNSHVTNDFDVNLEEYFGISGNSSNVTDSFDSFLQKDIYQMMVGTVSAQDKRLMEGTSHCRIARWWDRAVDVIHITSGKDKAIEIILNYYGIAREESMAFGDGGNDLDMIRYAGVGIAMGNAVDDVKYHADYVTDTCENDGIVSALEHFGL